MSTISLGADAAMLVVLSIACPSLAPPGCSLVFIQPLPPHHADLPSFDCSTNRAPPVLDTLFAATSLVSALTVPNKSDNQWRVFLGLPVGAIWAVSAAYGYKKTSQCETAKEVQASRYSHPPRQRRSPPPRVSDPPEPVPAPPPAYPPGNAAPQESLYGPIPAPDVAPAPGPPASPDGGVPG
jgi:hypothetical protein